MDPDLPPCPSCGGDEHEVVRATRQHVTLRCGSCGDVFRSSPRHPRTRDVPLIVSEGAESRRTHIEVVTTDDLEVGMEFDFEGHRLIITGLEAPGGVRGTHMAGQAVGTILAKGFDTVEVRYTLNEGPTTRSLARRADPDEVVAVGDVHEVDGVRVLVKSLKSDQNRTIRRGALSARHVVRVFCDPAPGRRP